MVVFTFVFGLTLGLTFSRKQTLKHPKTDYAIKNKRELEFNFQLSEIQYFLAERGGFEPPKPFRGLHAFQACQFSHSCIFPNAGQR